MIFLLPHPPLCFQIPDDWWEEANVAGFKPDGQSYRSSPPQIGDDLVHVPLAEIAPMLRKPGVRAATMGFRRHGLQPEKPGGIVDVLSAIASGVLLPPVTVYKTNATYAEGFTHLVADGYHRFYASHALGFTHLPCVVGHRWRSVMMFGDEEPIGAMAGSAAPDQSD